MWSSEREALHRTMRRAGETEGRQEKRREGGRAGETEGRMEGRRRREGGRCFIGDQRAVGNDCLFD